MSAAVSATIDSTTSPRPSTARVVAVDAVDARHRGRRVLLAAGAVGLRQDHDAAHDRRLRDADSGRIHVGGRDITDVPVHKRDMGMVFQSYALFPHRTVAENVAFGLRMREVPRPEIERRVTAALAQVALTGLRGAQARPALGRPAAARGAGPRASWSSRRCCCATSRWARSTASCASRCSSS